MASKMLLLWLFNSIFFAGKIFPIAWKIFLIVRINNYKFLYNKSIERRSLNIMKEYLTKIIKYFLKCLLVVPYTIYSLLFKCKNNFFKFFNLQKNSLLETALKIENKLDRLEEEPVIFKKEKQNTLSDFLEECNILTKKLRIINTIEAQQLRKRIQFKLLSLKYRLEEKNGGIDTVPVQQPLVNILRKIVLDWKSVHPFQRGDEGVSERDLFQILTTSQYPEFVYLLIDDKVTRDHFMTWTFQDGNSPKIFIEYPALQQKLRTSFLSNRIGKINNQCLKIKKIEKFVNGEFLFEKIVTLPFEGIEINILNPHQKISFKGHLTLTISEIFEMFKDKNYRVGNLEFLAQGICNWNVHKWGFWDDLKKEYSVIDLNQEYWWKQLPSIEIISKEEASQRYEQNLNGKNWCVAATATRGSPSLDYENTHAFLELAIPDENGSYNIYDFGKFATFFPSTFFEGLSVFCHNLHAAVAFPDENIFYSHRQQTYHGFTISMEQGLKLLTAIKYDVFKSNQKNFVYQIESDNCAKWVHFHLVGILGEENVPDMFRMHLLDTEPKSFVSSIFRLIKKLPKSLQTRAMTICHLPLGAAKKTWIFEEGKKVCKSLTRHEFWQTGVVYLPALLHKKKEEGLLNTLIIITRVVSLHFNKIFKISTVPNVYTSIKTFNRFLKILFKHIELNYLKYICYTFSRTLLKKYCITREAINLH